MTPHDEYLRLGTEEGSRLKAYRELFKARLDAETVGQMRDVTNGNFALGTSRFATEIECALGRRARPGKAGRPARDE